MLSFLNTLFFKPATEVPQKNSAKLLEEKLDALILQSTTSSLIGEIEKASDITNQMHLTN